jgi:hypothetical protein
MAEIASDGRNGRGGDVADGGAHAGGFRYAAVGAAPADSDLLYFAFVNYTTLGYGDITPVQAWRLIGPMTAMNGIGWSTAVLFEVLYRALELRDSISPAGRG